MLIFQKAVTPQHYLSYTATHANSPQGSGADKQRKGVDRLDGGDNFGKCLWLWVRDAFTALPYYRVCLV